MDQYFREFKVIEIQRTFYKLPRIQTTIKWRDLAPTEFEFTLKVPQFITHEPTSSTYRKAGIEISSAEKNLYGSFKPTEQVFKAWDEIRKRAKILRAKIVVFQCPASFKPTKENIENMRNFFLTIDRKDFLCVWEPRGKWEDSIIMALCKELDLIHCVDPFLRKSVWGELKYFRLHGGPRYRHKYTDAELEALRKKCEDETYCMFNNRYMYEDARKFKKIIS